MSPEEATSRSQTAAPDTLPAPRSTGSSQPSVLPEVCPQAKQEALNEALRDQRARITERTKELTESIVYLARYNPQEVLTAIEALPPATDPLIKEALEKMYGTADSTKVTNLAQSINKNSNQETPYKKVKKLAETIEERTACVERVATIKFAMKAPVVQMTRWEKVKKNAIDQGWELLKTQIDDTDKKQAKMIFTDLYGFILENLHDLSCAVEKRVQGNLRQAINPTMLEPPHDLFGRLPARYPGKPTN